MANGKKRPRFEFQCHHCKGLTMIEPIFADYKPRHKKIKTHYEAWARFWWGWERDETGRKHCMIVYEGREFTPNEITVKINKGQRNAWKFWRFDNGERFITLSELADSIT